MVHTDIILMPGHLRLTLNKIIWGSRTSHPFRKFMSVERINIPVGQPVILLN